MKKQKAVIGNDIIAVKHCLEAGEVVAIPTETVYGLAANALDPLAVAKIFEVKKRPFFDPLIVHIDSLDSAMRYAKSIPEPLLKLAERFWPGPLTLLLPKKDIIPDIVTGGLDRVALRVPVHPVTLTLLETLDFPLAAPSANPFGYVSPTTPAHVLKQLGNSIPYILDGGPCQIGVESTIVGMENGVPTIFRFGGLPVEEIEKEIGEVARMLHSSSNPGAPGMLDSHYAPGIPLFVGDIEKMLEERKGQKLGVISFQKKYSGANIISSYVLSPSGDIKEAAKNLFSALRSFEGSQADAILAEFVPAKGVGLAVNDRLNRARFKLGG